MDKFDPDLPDLIQFLVPLYKCLHYNCLSWQGPGVKFMVSFRLFCGKKIPMVTINGGSTEPDPPEIDGLGVP